MCMCVYGAGVSAKSIKLSTRSQRRSETKWKYKKRREKKYDSNEPIAIIAAIAIGPATNGSNWKNEEATHRKQLKKWEKKNNKKEAKMKWTNFSILFFFFFNIIIVVSIVRHLYIRRTRPAIDYPPIRYLHLSMAAQSRAHQTHVCKRELGKKNNERERKIPMSDDVQNTCALWTACSSSHKT